MVGETVERGCEKEGWVDWMVREGDRGVGVM